MDVNTESNKPQFGPVAALKFVRTADKKGEEVPL